MLDNLDVTMICGLVTFTLIYFVRELDGPFGVFWHLRLHLKVDPDGNPVGFFSEMFACYWCLATWVSLPVVLISALFYPAGLGIMIILYLIYSWAASIAIAGMLYTLVDR